MTVSDAARADASGPLAIGSSFMAHSRNLVEMGSFSERKNLAEQLSLTARKKEETSRHSSPVLGVRLLTALQVLQAPTAARQLLRYGFQGE